MEPISDDELGADEFEDSQDDTGTDGPVDPTPLAPELDSVSGGVIQEPAWPSPDRSAIDKDQRILTRVSNLRTMATTNSAIANHLKALGLDEDH